MSVPSEWDTSTLFTGKLFNILTSKTELLPSLYNVLSKLSADVHTQLASRSAAATAAEVQDWLETSARTHLGTECTVTQHTSTTPGDQIDWTNVRISYPSSKCDLARDGPFPTFKPRNRVQDGSIYWLSSHDTPGRAPGLGDTPENKITVVKRKGQPYEVRWVLSDRVSELGSQAHLMDAQAGVMADDA